MVPAWVDKGRSDLALAMETKDRQKLPSPFITHDVHNFDSDPILCRIRQIGFNNSADDKVSVIYVPCYLNGSDGIFNMSYYQLMPGFDATVFPSYYEPWGYTPLESVAWGVPTVTTSLSGFGQWILDSFDNSFKACGVRVETRTDSNYETVRDNISDDLQSLIDATKSEKTAISKAAVATAAAAAWTNFISYYITAFDIALRNAKARNK